MSRVVWKYELKMGETKLVLPRQSKVIATGAQGGKICIWVEQSPKDGVEGLEHIFFVVGTGHQLPTGFTYMFHVGTVFAPPFVWHIYEGVGK